PHWAWQALYAAGLLLLTYLLIYLRKLRHRRLPDPSVPAPDDGAAPSNNGHRWRRIGHFDRPAYCGVSGGAAMLEGAVCQHCGLCVSDSELSVAVRAVPCKPVALIPSSSSPSSDADIEGTPHHWVEGNLPAYSMCCVCRDACGEAGRLCDLRCAWCQRCVHPDCAQLTANGAPSTREGGEANKISNADASQRRQLPRLCDFGRYADAVVPPHCVQLSKPTRRRQPSLLSMVRAPRLPAVWRPLIVLANRHSGGGEGDQVLQRFRAVLNPAQVLDLSEVPPKVALGWCRLVPKGVTARLLVCGGDGTVGWVLSAIEELGLSPPPPLAIFPLGTGNDLSRVLGWGPGSSADDLDSVDALLSDLANASVDRLDRWLVSVKPSRSMLLSRSKRLTMSNYFSLGVDALVALNFDSARRSLPALTGSRMINKLWYFGYGTRDLWERACRNLHRRLTVILDGRTLNLPELEGLVVLNIASWGSGCRPWGSSASPTVSDDSSSAKMSNPASSAAQPDAQLHFRPQSHGDGRFELMGLHSSFHMAQLQVGLAPAIRLGQGSNLQIVLRSGSVPVQVDGEPWLQGPCTFTVAHRGQAAVLRCATDKSQGL
ncbi:hypothetical protein BOX15_Mlig007917g1, partial [Macrostomum lignano]